MKTILRERGLIPGETVVVSADVYDGDLDARMFVCLSGGGMLPGRAGNIRGSWADDATYDVIARAHIDWEATTDLLSPQGWALVDVGAVDVLIQPRDQNPDNIVQGVLCARGVVLSVHRAGRDTVARVALFLDTVDVKTVSEFTIEVDVRDLVRVTP